MGGNPGALGIGLQTVQMPPTVAVENIKAIEDTFLFSEIPGKRDWSEFLIETFKEDYPNSDDLFNAVAISVQRIRNGFIPIKVMDMYNEIQCFNGMAACK